MTIREDFNNAAQWEREYVKQAGAKGVVVGVSGGIDSCIAAAVSVEALGADNVLGVIMPCDSNDQDKKDAMRIADWLGIETVTIELASANSALASSIQYPQTRGNVFTSFEELTFANIKSRLRMVTLYAIANHKSFLVCGTTNKSEAMLGYYTKYGDGGVDIEPLMDFFKTEIYEMANEIGAPQQVIDKDPSAGLWNGQTDADELGMEYDRLDLILGVLCGDEDGQEIDPQYISDKDVANIEERVRANAHKSRAPFSFQRNAKLGYGGGCCNCS